MNTLKRLRGIEVINTIYCYVTLKIHKFGGLGNVIT